MVFQGLAAALLIVVAGRQPNFLVHLRHNNKNGDRIGTVLEWECAPVELFRTLRF